MQISIFGNPDLPIDAIPVVLIEPLRKAFPDIEFIHQDPNEECVPPEAAKKGGEPWHIIDSVKGISNVTIITDLDLLQIKKRLTMHDYDLGMHLTLLKKIYPDLKINIIGVPQLMEKKEALQKVAHILKTSVV